MSSQKEQAIEQDESAIREGLLLLTQQQSNDAAEESNGRVFWATYSADVVGTTGQLLVDLDCVGGVKLRFQGVHNTAGIVGKVWGTGPGVLMVDPESLYGKEVDYVFATTPGLFVTISNVTWISTGNMTGVGAGMTTIPPSIGRGKFTKRT